MCYNRGASLHFKESQVSQGGPLRWAALADWSFERVRKSKGVFQGCALIMFWINRWI